MDGSDYLAKGSSAKYYLHKDQIFDFKRNLAIKLIKKHQLKDLLQVNEFINNQNLSPKQKDQIYNYCKMLFNQKQKAIQQAKKTLESYEF